MKDHGWWSLLYDEERKLAQKYPEWIDVTELGDVADRFADLAIATHEPVEQAIRHFATSGQWPEMTDKVGAMVRTRLTAALDLWGVLELANRALKFQFPKHDHPQERVILFLLILLWESVGFGVIHGSLESARREGGDGKPGRFSHN